MRLLKTNYFHISKLNNFKYPGKLLFANRYSSESIVDENTSADKQAEFIEKRISLWNELKAEYDDTLKTKPNKSIKVELHYGRKYEAAVSWQSTPIQIFREIYKKAADNAIVAKVNNELWDLNRPLEHDCKMELLTFEDLLAKKVLWHSSAHVVGSVLETMYGSLLNTGPATNNGFFYEFYNNDKIISANDYYIIDKHIKKILRQRIPFERIEVSKANLLKLFSYNKFKRKMIEEQITDSGIVYRCGSLVDLCTGPHIRHTGLIATLKILNNTTHQSKDGMKLNRIMGIAFPHGKDLKQWALNREAAAKCDHRKLGESLDLFFFHESSPGSCFFQPKGAHIYNTLLNFIKDEYKRRGFDEIITPNIFKSDLWKVSGHWDHYAENIFSFKARDQNEFVLKPTNCPAHCLMFAHKIRSYRELPLRFADFGVLHRDEPTDGLTGLTSVTRFQQDDAYIFCTAEQIQDEIDSCLDFLSLVYGTFGFQFSLMLSTPPDSYLGDLDVWTKAESALENSLNKFGKPWKRNSGNGVSYGPKIDITITDALNRAHQCGTIQLDFMLPQRFKLMYDDGNDMKCTPVMIHQTIFGSIERFMAILIEQSVQSGGRFPFFISPNQIMVVSIHTNVNENAEKIRRKLQDANFRVEADLRPILFHKKVRDARVAQFNFILTVNNTNLVLVSTRDGQLHGEIDVDELIIRLKKLSREFNLNDNEF